MTLFNGELVAEYDESLAADQSRGSWSVRNASLTDVASQLLQPVITSELTPTSRYVLSSLPTLISKWKIAVAPPSPLSMKISKNSGASLCVLQGDRIEIRCYSEKGEEDVVMLPIPTDPFPHWRVLSWSTDASLVGIGESDGSIRVLHGKHGGPFVPLFVIEGSPCLNGSRDSGAITPKPFDPLMGIAIIPVEFRESLNLTKESHTHELLTFSFNGNFRVYRINLPGLLSVETIASNSLISATSSISFWKKAYSIPHDGSANELVKFWHSVSMSEYYHTITALDLDVRRRSLFISGLCSKQLYASRFEGPFEKSGVPSIVELKLLGANPFYQLIDSKGQPHFLKFSNLAPTKRLEGPLSNLFDVMGDLRVNAFSLLTKRDYLPAGSIVRQISTSQSTSGDILTVDLAGSVMLWGRGSGKRLKSWSTEELLAARGSLMKGGIKTAKSRALYAKWWTATSIAVIFSDGFLSVFDIERMEECLMAEEFSSIIYPDLVVVENGKVYILETYMTQSMTNHHDSKTTDSTLLEKLFHPPSFSLYGLSQFIGTTPNRPYQYNLVAFSEVTPVEALHIKLAQREYGAALDLCERFSIDVDEVHKARWCHSNLDEQAIFDFLSRVNDREWALRDVISRIPNSAHILRGLLKYAVRHTEHITMDDLNKEFEDLLEGISGVKTSETKKKAEGTVTATTLCIIRMKALKYLDRLETFEAISSSLARNESLSFSSMFSSFRNQDIVEFAKRFAAEGNVNALELLFTRHGELLPFRFEILRQLPSTIDIASLRKVLPRQDAETGLEVIRRSIPWRQPDWTETNPEVVEILLGFELAEETLFKCGAKSGIPVEGESSAEFLSAWYIDYIKNVERESGQTNLALSITIMARAAPFNIAGLDELHHSLQTLNDLNYVCGCLEIDLKELESMPTEDVIRQALDDSISDSNVFLMRVRTVIVPYMQRLSNLGQGDFEGVFDSYLIEVASKNIRSCAKVFEYSRGGIPMSDRIITPQSRLAKLILHCAYLSNIAAADTDTLHNMFRSLPDLEQIKSEGQINSLIGEQSSQNLADRIKDFQSHMEALEILTKYDIHASMHALLHAKETDSRDQRLTLNKFLRYVADDRDRSNEDKEWLSLFRDIRFVYGSGVFPEIDESEAQKDYLRLALNAGKFSLVKGLVSDKAFSIDHSEIEEIVRTAERSLYDNADSGDMRKGLLRMALECLETIPISPTIQAEIDFIYGTSLLFNAYVGIAPDVSPPLPIQIRLCKERLDLVANLIALHPKNRNPDRNLLIDIGRKLTNRRGASLEVRIRGMVATWALSHGNIELSLKICEEMMGVSTTKPSSDTFSIDEEWRVALRLAQEGGRIISRSTRRQLITFCMEWCQPSCLKEVIEAARLIEISEVLQDPGADVDLEHASAELRLRSNTLGSFKSKALRNAGLPLHIFYATDAVSGRTPYFVEPSAQVSESEILLVAQRVKALRTYRRLSNSSSNESEWNIAEEISSRDKDWCRLAQIAFESGDSGLALTLLLDLHHDEGAFEFFKTLSASRHHDLFSVYFCCIRALESLLKKDYPDASLTLESQKPSHIIESVERIAERVSHMIETDINPKEDPNLHNALTCLRHAYTFSARSKSDHHDKILNNVLSRSEIDETLFKADANYRKEALFTIATSTAESLKTFFDITLICSKFGWDPSSLAIERIASLIVSGEVDTSKLEEEFESLKPLLAHESSYARIKELHNTVMEVCPLPKIAAFYKITVSVLMLAHDSFPEEVTSNLKERVRFILWLNEHPNNIFSNWKFSHMLALNYGSDSSSILASKFQKEWHEESGNVQTLRSMGATLRRLANIHYLPIFNDEANYLAIKKQQTSLVDTASLLYKNYVIEKIEESEWEYAEEERISEDLEEIEYLLSGMTPSDLAECLTLCCSGEKASAIPVDLRIRLIDTTVSLFSVFMPPFLVYRMLANTNLSKLSEPSTGTRLYSERIQQFDLTYGEAPEDAASLCMRMVVAGASPYLVEKTCDLVGKCLQQNSPEEVGTSDLATLFNPGSIYKQAIKCVLGLQSENFTNVFRRGVESPIDALDRLTKAAVSFKPAEYVGRKPKSDNGWESDGWDEDEDMHEGDEVTQSSGRNLASCVEAVLTDSLRESSASISPDIQLGIVSILKKHFGKDVVDTQKLKGFKVLSILRALWDIEPSEENFDSAETRKALFGRILQKTRSSEQCAGLAQILAEWSDMNAVERTAQSLSDDLKPMWKAVVRKSVVSNAIALLLVLRSSEALMDLFDDELNKFVESELIKIETPEAIETFLKYALMSRTLHAERVSDLLTLFFKEEERLVDPQLYLLILVHNLEHLVPPTFWPSMVHALTWLQLPHIEASIAATISRSHSNDAHPARPRLAMLSAVHELYLRLACNVVLCLVEQRRLTKAGDIALKILGVPPSAASGVATRVSAVKNFLKTRLTAGSSDGDWKRLLARPSLAGLGMEPGTLERDAIAEVIAVEMIRGFELEQRDSEEKDRIAIALRQLDELQR
ncbi:hypothetical protein HDU67_008689 [Dinochytrium kinnereticum]|nr:hypothetical protein HDU67_008689 [Dinochytrium kinnereticum]